MERIYTSKAIEYSGKKATICGWIEAVRSHGKILFVDVRDKTGVLQLVFIPSKKELYKSANELRSEWVVRVEGKISDRPPKMVNPKIKTGKIEMLVEDLEIFSKAKALPFSIDKDGYEINEEKRMKYRYVDLRRKRLQRNLLARHNVIQFMREFLSEQDFIEVETPILTKSTPEGARDFIVPSRIEAGKFYALPQSPQQYKQLLQVAGVEKYFQIARCFRDEDARADRQAEFTQLDIEMSFTGEKEILDLIEKLYIALIKKLFPEKKIQKIPFPRMSYEEAMKKHKTDKPDLRKNKNDPDELAFLFVTDFPMFEWKKGEKRWDVMHHPFTRPKVRDIKEMKKDPGKVPAYQYDFVLNGVEIGGGSLRSYKPEILEAVFEIMGHKKTDIKDKFGHLLEAFEFGVPPHGGIAPGIDRFLSLLLNEPNIREVIPFPKTGDNRALMMGAPDAVSADQLKELNIKIIKPKK